MAEIIGAIATSHIPAIGKAIAEKRQDEPYWKPFFDGYVRPREWLAAMKPDLLKIRVDDNLKTALKMGEPAWRAAIAEAHARKLPIAVHVFYLADAKATLAAGADLIAHSVRDQAVDAAFITGLTSRQVCYSPTLTRELSTFVYESTPTWVDDPFFLKGAEAGVPALLKDASRQQAFRASDAWKLGQQYKAGLEIAKKDRKSIRLNSSHT